MAHCAGRNSDRSLTKFGALSSLGVPCERREVFPSTSFPAFDNGHSSDKVSGEPPEL